MRCSQAYSEERRPIFKETAEDFIEAGIRRDREFLRRYSPERDRGRIRARLAGARQCQRRRAC